MEGWGGGGGLFSYLILFQGLSFLHLEITYSLPNCVMHFKKKHSFMKKVILICLKMNLKISQKGFKKSKIVTF